MKRLYLFMVALLLTLGLGLPAAAQNGTTVAYTVAASNLYTVTNNGTEPLVSFTDCLVANQTYTLDFAVTVTTPRSLTATVVTVGEGSFNFIPQGFTPPTIQTSGTSPQTVSVRGTFRAGSNVFPRGPDSNDALAIYLEGPDEEVLGDAQLTVAFACVAAPAPLPGTGAPDGLGTRVALGALAASVTMLAVGYVLRRRGQTA